MKIELTELPSGSAPRADGRGEAHVRVLTNSPIGPQEWPAISKAVAEKRGGFFDDYENAFEAFYPELTELEDDEDSYDGYGWEQWFVIAARVRTTE